jgi:serine/threonine protein kinase
LSGQGAFGKVYTAESEDGTVVAVKFSIVQDAVQLVHELDTLHQLQKLPHAHVAAMLASKVIGQPARQAIFILAYAADDVSKLISRRALSPALAAEFAPQAAHGLSHLHEMGILHRDLKPANLLVAFTSTGHPSLQVTDFSLASILSTYNSTRLMTPAMDAQLYYISSCMCVVDSCLQSSHASNVISWHLGHR